LFGADGCERPCKASSDCAEGQRCRYTLLLGHDCTTSSVEVCGRTADGGCECSFNADCINPDICVDATRFPTEDDCKVADASCADLQFFYSNSSPDPEIDPKSEKGKALAACHAASEERAAAIDCTLPSR
jgi:hypothetical protein